MSGSEQEDIPLTRLRLGNGLRAIVAPQRYGSRFGVAMHFGAGFRSEEPGREGYAHLFEHLMFTGSEALPDGRFHDHVRAAGAVANGTTHQDYTEYHQVVPPSALEDALFAEADRIRAPRFTERALAEQLDGIEAEINAAYSTPLGGLPWPALPTVLFRRFANTHDGYGDLTQLRRARLDDCREFFERHYAPSNAVLTVTGPGDPEAVLELVRRYFAGIPARPSSPPPPFDEPEQLKDEWVCCEEPGIPDPVVAIGQRLPDPASNLPGYLAHMVLATLLGTEPDGLGADRIDAGCGFFGPLDARDPDALIVTALAESGQDGADVAEAVRSRWARYADEAGSGDFAERVGRAVGSLTFQHHRHHAEVRSRALALGRFETLFDRAELVDELPAHFRSVEPGHVAAAARALAHAPRGVVVLEPGARRTRPVPPRDAEPPSPAVPGGAVHGAAVPDGAAREGGMSGAVSGGAVSGSVASDGEVPGGAMPDDAVSDGAVREDAASGGTVDAAHVRRFRASRGPAATSVGPDSVRTSLHRRYTDELRDTSLANGFRVVAARDGRSPLVELRMRCPLSASGWRAGTAVEQLTRRLNAAAGSRVREFGELTVSTDGEWFDVSGSVSAEGLDDWLSVLAEVLLSLPALSGRFASEPVPVHRTPERGTDDVVRRFWLDVGGGNAGEHRAEAGGPILVRPQSGALTAIGAVDPARLTELIAARLSSWTGSAAPEDSAQVGESRLLASRSVRSETVKVVPAPGVTEARVLRCAAEPEGGPTEAARYLATAVVGGHARSRLAGRSLSRAAAGYQIFCGRDVLAGQPRSYIRAVASAERVPDVLSDIDAEVRKLAGSGIDEAETALSREYCAAQLLSAFDSPSALAGILSRTVAAGGRAESLSDLPGRISATTAEEVSAAATALFGAPGVLTVVLGDVDVEDLASD